MSKLLRLALAVSALSCLPAHAETAYYREPAVHGNTLVFTAEGDLWRVAASGGQAQRLTTHAGQETQAAISPDGQWLAFLASYDAGPEAYVMPLTGGAPKRVSFEDAQVDVLGWTPAGEVLYATAAVIGPGSSRSVRAVDPVSLRQRTLPFADANQASFDADGGQVFFTRFGLHITGDHARGYRGGARGQLWRANTNGNDEAVRLGADVDASLSNPMWWNGRLYFLSNAGGSDNLWSMAADGSDLAQLTRYQDFNVIDPQLGDGRIAFQHGADIHVLDLASGTERKVDIDIASDFEQRRLRWLDKPLDYLDFASLSADGSRALLTARGAVTTAGTDARRRIGIAIPEGARARAAVGSADGQWIYAIADIGGTEEIWRFPADGSGPGKALTRDSKVRRWHLYPSPDGQALAFDDQEARLSVLELESGRIRVLDDDERSGDDPFAPVAWSADSRSLATARPDSSEGRSQILLLARDGSRKAVLTSDRYASTSPVFSRDGQWLYFLSDRHFESTVGSPWGDRNLGPSFDRRTRIYALALQAGNRFPFQTPTELDPKKDDSGGKDKDKDDKGSAAKAIEWDGLAARLFTVPVEAGNFSRLGIDAKRLYVLDQPAGTRVAKELKTIAIGHEKTEPTTFARNLDSWALSANAEKVLLVTYREQGAGDLFIVDAGAKAPESMKDRRVDIGNWRLAVDPRAEWKQMFVDAWRMHREFSFDPHMRGLDWNAVRARYEPLLARVADRSELDDLLGQMTGELGILHSQVRGGELRKDPEVAQPASLGAEFETTDKSLRIAHILRGDPELPEEAAPLARPGVDAKEGDVLVAVNGRRVANLADLSRALANQAEHQVLLELERQGKSVRTVAKAINARAEANLRQGDWEQRLGARVLERSQGRIGYLHLRAMGSNDIATFAREFYTNIERGGLIIDVRRNNGGSIDSWIIEKLLRRTWAFWTSPGAKGDPTLNMQQTFRGHLAVLIDERTYSDGETFAAGIKTLGLGPLIGQPTAGAGIWLSGRNPLVDGGIARIAEFGQFDLASGRWIIEGRGVAPDIEVVNPPRATFAGGDAQLDAAIAYLEGKLKSEPVPVPKPGAISPVGTPGWDLR